MMNTTTNNSNYPGIMPGTIDTSYSNTSYTNNYSFYSGDIPNSNTSHGNTSHGDYSSNNYYAPPSTGQQQHPPNLDADYGIETPTGYPSLPDSGNVEGTYRLRLLVFCVGLLALTGTGVGVAVGAGFGSGSSSHDNEENSSVSQTPLNETILPTTVIPSTPAPTISQPFPTTKPIAEPPSSAQRPTIASSPRPSPPPTFFPSAPPTLTPHVAVPTTLPSQSPSFTRQVGIQSFLQPHLGDAVYNTASNYFLAVQWISNVDPLGWETTHANFLERFLMAYWYIDATNRGRLSWRSCNPPNPIGSASFCVFERADFAASTIPNLQYAQDRAARWLSGTHQCQWAGITCLPDDSIDRIELNGHGIQGTLPSELGLLRNGQSLQLIFNEIGGTLPVDLVGFVDLEFHYNRLVGTIPPAYFVRNYDRLNLGNNTLTGTLPDPMALPSNNVAGLFLFNNQLSGTIPTTIGYLRNLQFSRIDDNGFNGTLPTELGLLPNLREFWIHRNDLEGSIPSELGLLTSLTDLLLFGNQRLNGTIPTSLYQLRGLTRWLAHSQSLSGTISSLIGGLTSLTRLSLAYNQLSGSIPTQLGNLNTLAHIDLEGNNLTGTVPASVCGLPAANTQLQTDCLAIRNNNAEITCSCCSLCCATDATNNVCQ